MNSTFSTLIITIFVAWTTQAFPSNETTPVTATVTKDLRLTFDGPEFGSGSNKLSVSGLPLGSVKLYFEPIQNTPYNIPTAFFETTSTNTPVSKNSKKIPSPPRRQYPACKDGSGGLCVPSKSCPADKKPETVNVGACGSGQECCFGVPPSNTPCQDNGGECVEASRCGNGPQLKSSTECKHGNGETCCIWVF